MKIQNASVLGYSRDDSQFSTLFNRNGISSVFPTAFGNVEDGNAITRQIDVFQPHLVIHLAAQSLVKYGHTNPVETFATNAVGTAQVLESSLISRDLLGVLVVTTDKVYAESSEVRLETSTLGGSDPYSCSKVAAEEAVKAFRDRYDRLGIPLAVVRGGNIIGGGDWSRNRLVPDLVRAYANSERLSLRFPNSTRPWQHVLDLVYAYSLIAHNMISNPGPATNTEYNVGPAQGSSSSVLELVQMFAENGLPVEISIQPGVQHEAKTLAIDSTKIFNSLGWRPRINLTDSVGLSSKWYKLVIENKLDPHELTSWQVWEYLDSGRA